VCHLLLLHDDLLRKHLHGVDAASVPLTYLEDLAECALSDELENLKVFGTVVLLLDLLEVELQVNLSGNNTSLALSGL